VSCQADLSLTRGIPEHLFWDNSSEFRAGVIHGWLVSLSVKTSCGEPRENGYIESINGRLRDELLDRGRLDGRSAKPKRLLNGSGERTTPIGHVAFWTTGHRCQKRFSDFRPAVPEIQLTHWHKRWVLAGMRS
jgi:hypothetical protein